MDYSKLPVLPVSPIPLPPIAADSGSQPQTTAAADPAAAPEPRTKNQEQRTLPDVPFTLPNHRPLLMSLHIDAVMHQVFAGERWFLSCPTKPIEVYTFLWMCANPPVRGQTALWEAMDWLETGPAPEDAAWLPLYLRPYDLFRTALDWFEDQGLPEDFPGYAVLASALWNHHKQGEVVLDPGATTGTLPEKKKPGARIRTPLMSSSTSSPEATPSSGKMPSTASPSATRSKPGTATSSRKGSPSSPPRISPGGGKKRKKGSGK